MKIFEVDTSIGPALSTPSPAELSGLVQFLDGRATDENAKKEISKTVKYFFMIYSLIINNDFLGFGSFASIDIDNVPSIWNISYIDIIG